MGLVSAGFRWGLGKYFVHGLVFATIFVIVVRSIFSNFNINLGNIIILVVLIPIIGYINSLLTMALWFPVKIKFWNFFSHGFVLMIPFLFASYILITVPPSFLGLKDSSILIFVQLMVGSFVYGFLGEKVARSWKQPSVITFPDPEGET